jgi:hypothetical protein
MDERIKRESKQRKPTGAFLPWIERYARSYLRFGPREVGFGWLTRDEQLAVLAMASELVGGHDRTRPEARRRRSA